MTDPESRLARIEQKAVDMQEEVKRVRDRVHDLEKDRVAIALLTEKVTMLAEETRRLADQMHGIALRAAQEAIQLALNTRDQISVRKRGFQYQGIMTGAAIATVVIEIVLHYA